jgi:hypothetical protein
MNKKEQNVARKQKLNEQLKVGAFVKNVWGATEVLKDTDDAFDNVVVMKEYA